MHMVITGGRHRGYSTLEGALSPHNCDRQKLNKTLPRLFSVYHSMPSTPDCPLGSHSDVCASFIRLARCRQPQTDRVRCFNYKMLVSAGSGTFKHLPTSLVNLLISTTLSKGTAAELKIRHGKQSVWCERQLLLQADHLPVQR
jgi:hypothetical protein